MAPSLETTRQIQFQMILETLLGNEHVYFQPPTNIQMEYPAIVYELDYVNTTFADDFPYHSKKRYQVTLIHADPNNDVKTKIGQLQMTRFVRHFRAGNLNHYIFNTYF